MVSEHTVNLDGNLSKVMERTWTEFKDDPLNR